MTNEIDLAWLVGWASIGYGVGGHFGLGVGLVTAAVVLAAALSGEWGDDS